MLPLLWQVMTPPVMSGATFDMHFSRSVSVAPMLMFIWPMMLLIMRFRACESLVRLRLRRHRFMLTDRGGTPMSLVNGLRRWWFKSTVLCMAILRLGHLRSVSLEVEHIDVFVLPMTAQ